MHIVSLPMPDRNWQVSEDRLPNLRDLLFMNRPLNAGEQCMNLVEEIKARLVENLKANLSRF